MDRDVRILLLADSHLGFDLPVRARVERRRRGHDFLANYARALAPALAGEVDVVVHAGDVFDRSSVVSTLAYQAFEPLRQIADKGIPVFVVPGNHERSRLPHLRFARHENLHVFAAAGTVAVTAGGVRVAFSGFPYERNDVRGHFATLIEETRWRDERADVRILCAHHCFEGATVGPADYTFTTASDVIRVREIPEEFDAVFTGHIHRHQVLRSDLERRPLAMPVLYPGSIERTALAEIGEPKGFLIVRARTRAERVELTWEFRELPARPMIRREIAVAELTPMALASAVEAIVAEVPRDAVVSITLVGALTDEQWQVVSSARLRAIVPRTMNLDVVPEERFASRARAPIGRSDAHAQLPLFA